MYMEFEKEAKFFITLRRCHLEKMDAEPSNVYYLQALQIFSYML